MIRKNVYVRVCQILQIKQMPLMGTLILVVVVVAAPLLIQLLANAPGKALRMAYILEPCNRM